jgi:ribonucleotide reductase alpha subunit
MSEVYVKVPKQIVKRDGSVVEFDSSKITTALRKCFTSIQREPKSSCEVLTDNILNVVGMKYDLPTVEKVQDVVELVLQSNGEYEAAKAYILYRNERTKERTQRHVPDTVKQAFDADDVYFPTALQKFQFYDKYSRFNYELGRRETWVETVDRTIAFLRELSENKLDDDEYERLRNGILNMHVMPSMRLLAMAGDAARRNNIALYNCSYMVVDSISAFVEALIISMNGCGVGFSVERHHVEKLPRIKRQTGVTPTTFVVEDTAEGWAGALRFGLQTWFDGGDVVFDFSLVRKAGEPLRTKGGRASGPEPLRKMLRFARERILAKQGSFLSSLDAHDIMCEVGNAAVAGGVRRTAMISLFDYDDYEMRHCKDGDFWQHNSQRWNANNSAVWPERELSQQEITRFMLDMVESGRGEPGIFNRKAANTTKPARRQEWEFGTNPCVVGSTIIAVADGRKNITIKQLVDEGKDADVYTMKDGEIVVRTMRNFRKTGTNVPVYRVLFNNGNEIIVTFNHKFILTNGDAYEAVSAIGHKVKTMSQNTNMFSLDRPSMFERLELYNQFILEHNRHPQKHEAEVLYASTQYVPDNPLYIASVDLYGFEDVYNGTVDDTHTYFAIGIHDSNEYVLNRNCGEIFLRESEFCNLTSVVSRQNDTPRFTKR